MEAQNAQQDPVAAQIGNVWNGLMGAMTAQGATREQIAQVAAATAAAVLGLTGEALWPGGTEDPPTETAWSAVDANVPPGEAIHWLALGDAHRTLAEYLEETRDA